MHPPPWDFSNARFPSSRTSTLLSMMPAINSVQKADGALNEWVFVTVLLTGNWSQPDSSTSHKLSGGAHTNGPHSPMSVPPPACPRGLRIWLYATHTAARAVTPMRRSAGMRRTPSRNIEGSVLLEGLNINLHFLSLPPPSPHPCKPCSRSGSDHGECLVERDERGHP